MDARARPGFDQAKDYYTSEEVAQFMKPKKKVQAEQALWRSCFDPFEPDSVKAVFRNTCPSSLPCSALAAADVVLCVALLTHKHLDLDRAKDI